MTAVHDGPRRDRTLSAWHARCEGEADPTQPLGEFDGTHDDALGWARTCKSAEILVFDPETGRLSRRVSERGPCIRADLALLSAGLSLAPRAGRGMGH